MWNTLLPLILSGPLGVFLGKCSKDRIDPALPDSPPSTEIWSSETSPPLLIPTPITPAAAAMAALLEAFSRLASLLEDSSFRRVGDGLDGLRDLDGLWWPPGIGDGEETKGFISWSAMEPLQQPVLLLLFRGDEDEKAGANGDGAIASVVSDDEELLLDDDDDDNEDGVVAVPSTVAPAKFGEEESKELERPDVAVVVVDKFPDVDVVAVNRQG